MNTGEMLTLTNRFKEIMASKVSTDMKDRRLAALMTDMEGVYSIPMLRRESF